MAISFMDAGVSLPPCLDKFRKSAEVTLKLKAERLAKESKQDSNNVSLGMLQKENITLKAEIKRLTLERPILLGRYRDDDPLLLAIEIRNKDWARMTLKMIGLPEVVRKG